MVLIQLTGKRTCLSSAARNHIGKTLSIFLNIFLANVLLHYLDLRGKISPKEIILLKEPVNMIRKGTYQNIFLQVTYDFSYDCCRQKTVI